MYPTWSDILSERRKLQLIILNNIVNFRRNVSTYSKIDHETSYDSKFLRVDLVLISMKSDIPF